MVISRMHFSSAGLFALALVVLMPGCAFLALMPGHAVSVPRERLLGDEWLKEMPGSAHVTISRDADFYRRELCYERISVDGKDQARIQPGERVDLYLPAGRHLIKVRPEGPCSGYAAQLERELGAGQWSWYRLDASGLERALTLTSYSTASASPVAPPAVPTLWQRFRGRPGRG